MFLLDEMLRQDGITRDEYTKLNSMLAESLGGDSDKMNADNEEMVEDELKRVICETTNDIIKIDKSELLKTLAEAKEEVNKDYFDAVIQLENLLDVFFIGEFLDGKPVLLMILENINALDGSTIEKSKLHRIKMLLDDIKSNRHHVHSVFMRLDDAQDREDMLHIWKQLVSEELLTDEQFKKLSNLEGMDLREIALIIKDTKF